MGKALIVAFIQTCNRCSMICERKEYTLSLLLAIERQKSNKN